MASNVYKISEQKGAAPDFYSRKMIDRVVEVVNTNADELNDVANDLYSDIGYKFTLWGTKTISQEKPLPASITSADFTVVDTQHPILAGAKALIITEDWNIGSDGYVHHQNHVFTLRIKDLDNNWVYTTTNNTGWVKFLYTYTPKNGVSTHEFMYMLVREAYPGSGTEGILTTPAIDSVSPKSNTQYGNFRNNNIMATNNIKDFLITAGNYSMGNTSVMRNPTHTFYVYAAF